MRASATLLIIFLLTAFFLVPGPGSADMLEQGLSQLASNRYDEAIKTFSSAIALTPDDAAAFCNRGVAWFYKSEHDRAIADFTRAIEIDPLYVMAYYNRGILWTEKADYDRAIADFTEALQIDPTYAEALFGRAVAWFFKGDDDRAIADSTKVLEINPNDAAAFCNRGVFWNRKADYDRAIADFTKAMEINPNRPEAFAQLVWILATCPDGKYRNGDRAVKLAQKALSLSPEPRFMATLAAAYAESGKFEDAVKTQKKVIALVTGQGDTKDLAEYKRQLKSYEANRPWRTTLAQTEDSALPVESSKPGTREAGKGAQTAALSSEEEASAVEKLLPTKRPRGTTPSQTEDSARPVEPSKPGTSEAGKGAQTAALSSEEKVFTAEGIPPERINFCLQTASCQQAKSAQQAVDQLVRQNYRAFYWGPDNRNWYRVCVGPFETRDEAVAWKKTMKSQGFRGQLLLVKADPTYIVDYRPIIQSDRQQAPPDLSKRFFSIQAGAFLVQGNAEGLKDRLQKTGYPSHLISKSGSDGKLWHFVLVGKYATRQEAQKAATRFSAKEKMPSYVYTVDVP